MKINFKLYTFFFAIAVLFAACEEENTLNINTPDGIVLTDPGIGTVVLNAQNEDNQAFLITWTDYTNSGEDNYTISLSTSDLFDVATDVGNSSTNSFSITQSMLNDLLFNVNSSPFIENTVYLRVSSNDIVSNFISFVAIPVQDDPVLASPMDGANYTLQIENSNQEAFEASWFFLNDNSLDISYTLEAASSGSDFSVVEVLGSVNNENSISISTADLNDAAIALGVDAETTGNLDLRVRSSYMDAEGMMVEAASNSATVTVTTFEPIDPQVFIVGNFLAASGYGSDWTPGNAVPIQSSGFEQTDFEGYVFMNVPSPEFKILPTNTSFDGDYGDDNTFSGVLVQEGESNIFVGTGAGYYYIQADTDQLTYSFTRTEWAITGAATPAGWPAGNEDQGQGMTYNDATGKWEITLFLESGDGFEYKFRANNDWGLNFGTDGDGDGSLDYGGGNFSVETSGTYLIELDLSNPRAYTQTVTLQ